MPKDRLQRERNAVFIESTLTKNVADDNVMSDGLEMIIPLSRTLESF